MTRNITLGVSSYSFHQRLSAGEMDVFDVIDWVAASDAEHLELAVLTDDPDSPLPNVSSDPAYLDRVRAAVGKQRQVAPHGGRCGRRPGP